MDKKFSQYVIWLIKKERENQGLSMEQLAGICKLSKSYLCKIINCSNYTDEHMLKIILKGLRIDFIFDSIKLKELDELLDNFYYSLVFYNMGEAHKNFEEIMRNKQIYEYSVLQLKYSLYLFAWYVSIKGDHSIIAKLDNILNEELFANIHINNQERQLYLDYKGVLLKDSHDYKNAILTLEQAKELGNYPLSYGMVCYHLAVAHFMEDNLFDAMFCNQIATDIFFTEFNYNRQLFSQIHLANIFSRSHQYLKTEETYKTMLKHVHYTKNKLLLNAVRSNLSWNLIVQGRYAEAISSFKLKSKTNKLNYKVDYFHLSWSYYMLNDYEKAMKWINLGFIVCIDDVLIYKRLELVKMFIEFHDQHDVLHQYLSSTFNEIKSELSYENKEFYLNLLVQECEKNFKYKEALKYQKELKF